MSVLSKNTLIRTASVFALGAALALPALTGAFANPASPDGTAKPERAAAWFERFDTNKDGVIDKSEIQAAREGIFERMDANKDGFIDADEAKSAHSHFQHGKRHGRMANPEERVKRAEAMFDRLDANKDGSISREEYKVHVDNVRERAEKAQERHENRQSKREGRKAEGKAGKGGLMRLDTNNDGRISKEEFLTGSAKWVERFDTNKDGQITRAEFDEASKKWREKREERRSKKAE
jgi:Ca2+-binding EF-hand superfamily protein